MAPPGVWLSALFFVVSGILEILLAVHDAPHPVPFTTLWQATGTAILHFLVAWGLWRRIAVCRSVAMVYCIAVVVTYVTALALALGPVPAAAARAVKPTNNERDDATEVQRTQRSTETTALGRAAHE
jgi:hypothetical protein